MAVKYKDYYEILGLPRSSSDQEIKKAFRKLARQYHPDVAKTKKGSEDRFKEINEAYEVLGNPLRRRRFDQLGNNWKPNSDIRSSPAYYQEFRNGKPYNPSNSNAGKDFEFVFGGSSGFSEFFDQVFGSKGYEPGASPDKAAVDEVEMAERGKDISGDIYLNLEEVAKGGERMVTVSRNESCETCRGQGEIYGRICAKCDGKGSSKKNQAYHVKIPVGVTEGQRLRISGAGDAGLNGGLPGDYFATVHIHQHPDFEIDGNNLIYDAEISPAEAVLGATLIIPTLKGEVNIKIPPGTQPGTRLRVRGRGMPNGAGIAGDLIVVAEVNIPDKISEHEKRLWAQLYQLNHHD